MRKALAAGAILATLGLSACTGEYYYEAEPIGGTTTSDPDTIDCFSIEVSQGNSDDDEELGTFCRQGGSDRDDD